MMMDKNEIVNEYNLHVKIMQSLKTKKARSDSLLEKYQQVIEETANIPANRMMYWTRDLRSFLDSVINSKLTDFEIQQEYDSFVQKMVKVVAASGKEDDHSETVHKMLNIILKLEESIQNSIPDMPTPTPAPVSYEKAEVTPTVEDKEEIEEPVDDVIVAAVDKELEDLKEDGLNNEDVNLSQTTTTILKKRKDGYTPRDTYSVNGKKWGRPRKYNE